MEHNWYDNNSKLSVMGIICLIIFLVLFFFSLFIMPFLIWELHYNVPDFVSNMIAYLEDTYYYSSPVSKTLVWLTFFIPCLITGYFSYYISCSIDKKNLLKDANIDEEQSKEISSVTNEQIKESASLGFKILILMAAIILIIFILQEFVKFTS
ncbi:TPA: hypothetical protein JBE46_06810 [Legionella pneumophila subsp. pneumophila]|uniref:Transmembrane protein n=1 Tax=Legionella pneumophila (strain Lens) TaxID=297245 RepID=Q5WXJ8_LEGPL|nr:hypothetical protein [Legionella pneumophila]AOW52292.1 hypothetical protein BE841_07375 [Legionella pneumophila subsp. pneumophila]AOW54116.1 hypothetical protein BE842_01380 [Legionella pneumophila subsp. pneumophila]AOW57590.1 hypothetical protein BE843_04595 [Legionella pneumophila subsp. pneumophila]AOW62230.1 hypothetical protein BE844_14185 [Legionella pneumophila subsp. pneumophila]AOW63089.1 hypothetical protein BE845_02950 [Legionella pneumophila subsp. pneumophila]